MATSGRCARVFVKGVSDGLMWTRGLLNYIRMLGLE
jgi:hypothetical protein